MVGVPIFSNEKLAAVLVAYTKSCENWSATTDRYVFNDYDLEIYFYLFRQIINAIKKWQDNEKIEQMNELLMQKAVTDELTGLYNRQGYSKLIHDILSDPDMCSQKQAFMYMDLDHFKHYNDTFGHHVGDAILIAFADIFRHNAPEGIDVIRFGGDEFGMIVPYKDKSEIIDIAKAILAEIEASNGFEEIVKHCALKDVSLEKEHYAGCSIGIAYMEDITGEEAFETARQNADSALYGVKENGRNNYREYQG
jgi:diguanylate cyclase (GGDEF)-like protein